MKGIVVFSNTPEEQMVHVQKIRKVFSDAGVKLKLNKFQFFTDTIDYLVLVILPGRLQITTELGKLPTDTIRRLKYPSTIREFRSFLGMCIVLAD